MEKEDRGSEIHFKNSNEKVSFSHSSFFADNEYALGCKWVHHKRRRFDFSLTFLPQNQSSV